MSKIKVCHISESTSGGVWTHLKQLAKHLPSSDYHQTFLLSGIKKPNLRSQSSLYGYPIVVIDMVNSINPWMDMRSLLKVISFLNKNRFDIIHCHSSKAGVIGRIAALLTRHKAVVYTPHAFAFLGYNIPIINVTYRLIEKFITNITDTIICVSRGEYELAIKSGFPRKKLCVIRNGVQIPTSINYLEKRRWLQEKGFEGTEKIIIFLGRLAPQKNPGMLIEAMSQLKRRDVVLLIVGDGPLKQTIEEDINRRGLINQIIMTGEVEDVSGFLSISDVFVSTSLWESMPYAILEAMSMGIPVIATKIPGVTDLINHGWNGYLVKPNNIQELCEAINTLLDRYELGGIWAANALELLKKEFTIEGMISSLDQTYRQIIMGKDK